MAVPVTPIVNGPAGLNLKNNFLNIFTRGTIGTMSPDRLTNSEKLNLDVSVAILLSPRGSNRLLLVKRGVGEGWSLPSGHLGPNEKLEEAVRRELAEETGLPGGWRNVNLLGPPQIAEFPEAGRTRIGVIYLAEFLNAPRIDKKGWKVAGDSDVIYAKPFTPRELMRLVDGNDVIYKQEFNRPQFIRHLIRSDGPHGSHGNVGYIETWLEDHLGRVEGLELVNDAFGSQWRYTAPYESKHRFVASW